MQRVAALADFGNGVGMAVDRTRFSFINPDLTVTLHRYPEGEWIGLDGTSFAEDTGIGVAETELHDERGRIGRGIQTILLDEWPEGVRPFGAGVGGRSLTTLTAMRQPRTWLSDDPRWGACRGWPSCAGR